MSNRKIKILLLSVIRLISSPVIGIRLQLIAGFLAIFVFAQVGYSQSTLRFNDPSPVLETGTALSQGARYRFRTVSPGVDALVTITTISNATLVTIDTILGFDDRFEPTIRTTGVNQQGYVRFDFQIVAAGTSTPKIVPAVYVSAQDIDGGGSANGIKEWVEFVNTGSVTVASPTLLVAGTPVAGGVRYNQVDSSNNQPGIGTGNAYEMYTTILSNSTTFTIIGGNLTQNGCSGADCDRQNSYAFDPVSSNQPAVNANVSVTKTGPTYVNVGATVTYTVIASNLGPTTAHGAIINDAVPGGLTGVTITCTGASGGVCPATAGLTTLSNVYITALPNGASVTFTISGTAASAGTLSNTATIAPPNGGTDPVPGNNTSNTVVTTVNVPPNIGLTKTCTLPANCTSSSQTPNTELAFKIDFINNGGSSASNLRLVDEIPANTDFKLGSASVTVETTGLTFVIEYSNDYNPGNPTAATWTYVPVSGGGGAGAGFDRNVKAIRWRVTAGNLSQTSPNNTGDVRFTVRIR